MTIDPVSTPIDPYRAPSQEVWDAMSASERAAVVRWLEQCPPAPPRRFRFCSSREESLDGRAVGFSVEVEENHSVRADEEKARADATAIELARLRGG